MERECNRKAGKGCERSRARVEGPRKGRGVKERVTIAGTKISRGTRKSVSMVNFPNTANPTADIIHSASTMKRMAIEDKYPLRQD